MPWRCVPAVVIHATAVLFLPCDIEGQELMTKTKSRPRFKNRLLADPGIPGTLRVWCRVPAQVQKTPALELFV